MVFRHGDDMIQFLLLQYFLNGLPGGQMEVIIPVNVVIMEARCVGGLKEAVWNEGKGKGLCVDFT